jgi:carbon monoxide dehydrogenase subunit G
MAERFEQKFELDSPIEIVWAFLTDPYQIVACLQGAAIANKVDQRTYEGSIAMKVGIVSASYSGKVTFEHIDAAKHEMRLIGTGQDLRGKGSAELKMLSRLRTTADGKTEVVVNSEVQITGLFAQMGRGMIDNVADQMLKRFAAALKQKLDVTRTKYSQIVKTHAESFAKIYGNKLAEIESISGVKVRPDGTNSASSPHDVLKYLEAVKQIAGDMIYNSAKIIVKSAAQKESVPLSEI